MSQENVELLRAFAEEGALARAGGEFDPEAAIARQAELWDPEIELDASEFPVLDITGFTGERTPLGTGGESGMPRGTPSDSSMSWLMRATEWSCCSTCDCAGARRESSSRPQKSRGSLRSGTG